MNDCCKGFIVEQKPVSCCALAANKLSTIVIETKSHYGPCFEVEPNQILVQARKDQLPWSFW